MAARWCRIQTIRSLDEDPRLVTDSDKRAVLWIGAPIQLQLRQVALHLPSVVGRSTVAERPVQSAPPLLPREKIPIAVKILMKVALC